MKRIFKKPLDKNMLKKNMYMFNNNWYICLSAFKPVKIIDGYRLPYRGTTFEMCKEDAIKFGFKINPGELKRVEITVKEIK